MKRLNQFNLKLILSLLIAALPFANAFSNKLVVSIISGGIDQANQTVTFDLSWQNSWRNPGTTAANWDAAWVFIKWRDCTASNNVQFTHGLISTNTGDHNFNVNSGSTAFEPTLSSGSGVGIDPSPNNTGVMLRSFTNPYAGTISARVRLKVNNLPTTGSLDLRVIGLEMVFVPQGSYYIGDGSSYQTITTSQITTEAAQTVSDGLFGSTALTDAFPKGFASFYIMKYEITQGQYVDFLNASPAIVQSMHWTANSTGNRYTITQNANTLVFSASRPFRACNFLSWADVATYLDWTALRPLSEMEYEKACRGGGPRTAYENAMAVTFNTRAVTITAGSEPGTEVITVPGNANICAGTSAFSGGDAGQGPLRGGIFATPSTLQRSETGASYYGAMELSGNVDEYYVATIAGITGQISAGGLAPGDGILDDGTGQFISTGWPLPLAPSNTIMHRGGSWNSTVTQDAAAASYLNVSNRGGGQVITRINTSGGRGGRSSTVLSNPLTIPYTGGIVTFTVPDGVTSLTIDAYGAGGGNTSAPNAGQGAEMKGVCAVTPGEVLQILVGGIANSTRGGAGGSFVVRAPYNTLSSVLVAAGGGGGQGTAGTVGTASHKNGQLNGGTAGPGYNGADAGGTSGNGGSSNSTGYGAGGGFLTNGAGLPYGGISYVNGGAGGTGSGIGGFGGGGTTPTSSYGAGGGGYSGGGCSASAGPGGGGGSIINGTVLVDSQTGRAVGVPGQVILNW